MNKNETPAIAGGQPAKTAPFSRGPRYGEEELAELKEALDQGTLFYSLGKKVKQFEEAFAEAHGAKFGVACSSGTAAIHAALIALGVGPGDEVITSPITDLGTVVPILYQGAVPVFADLDPQTYTLDPASVAAAVSPRTRAIIAVHLAGNACDLSGLRTLCDERGIALIEDSAQALGCEYDGRPVGTFGRVGCFSLNEFKHISCGDGGIAVTNDPALAVALRQATDKGYSRAPGATFRDAPFLANNYRMTELQGAVAVAQVRKLPSIVARRRAWCGELSRRLQDVTGISLPRPTPNCSPSWWFYLMRVQPKILCADADAFAAALRAEGLPCSAHYIGQCVYEFPLFSEHRAFGDAGSRFHPYSQFDYHTGLCPEAEAILQTAVMLSINENYSAQDLDETEHAIRRTAAWFREGR